MLRPCPKRVHRPRQYCTQSQNQFSCFFFPSGALLELLKTLVVSILGDFHMFFLRGGPGRGHCLYKQRNTSKQTRLRKALLHYFSRSLRHKGQQGSAIVSAQNSDSHLVPFFPRLCCLRTKKDHCLNASLPCLPIDECIDKARSIHSTNTKQPMKDGTRGQAQILTRAKAITKHHLNHPCGSLIEKSQPPKEKKNRKF